MVRTITPIEPDEIKLDKINDPEVAQIVAEHMQPPEPVPTSEEEEDSEAMELPEQSQTPKLSASAEYHEKEMEALRTQVQQMQAGMYQSVMKLKQDQYSQLQKELNDTANDISSTERLVMDLQDEIKKLEEWNTAKGYYERSAFKFEKYRNVLVNQVIPSLKGLLNDFGGVRKNLEIINKLIQKKGGEVEE
jgi:chromosome segregation ATPase